MQNKELTQSEQRLVKIISFTRIAMLLDATSVVVEGLMNSTSIFSTSFIVIATAALLLELPIRWIRAGNKSFAFSTFLMLISCALFVSMWTRGGLYSVGVVGIPVIILVSVLYGRMRDMLWLLVAIVFYVIFLGQTSLVSANDASTVAYQLPVIVLFICVGGYISLAIGGDIRAAFLSLNEETERLKTSQDSIQLLSRTDFLTGLVNAKQACLNYQELLSTLTSEERIFFCFIDLDNFKEINDLFDHKAGDNLLVLISDRLKAVVDGKANVCRLSGDEFIIFCKEDSDYDASIFAEILLDAIEQPHTLFGTSAQITASMGIATTQRISFNKIRKKASMAMYKAKRETKSRFYLYSDILEEQYMRRVYVLHGLQDAVKEGVLELHFQPKVDLETQQINGLEALIRWTKGNPHNYNPDEFMTVIESTELVHDIGNWVIKEACIACKEWHKEGHILPVAVNVSAQQLYRPDFAENVQQILTSLDLDGRFLEIELTERFFVEQNESVEKQLASLRKAGVNLTIDDFGTGYSNVSYLMNLEANVLKLDKSFIDRIHNNPTMRSMIIAIIEIARAGKMKVVAEGIETFADKEAMTALGCDVGQGFYWSRPVNQKAVLQLLTGELNA